MTESDRRAALRLRIVMKQQLNEAARNPDTRTSIEVGTAGDAGFPGASSRGLPPPAQEVVGILPNPPRGLVRPADVVSHHADFGQGCKQPRLAPHTPLRIGDLGLSARDTVVGDDLSGSLGLSARNSGTVSYTHLTLPTNREV